MRCDRRKELAPGVIPQIPCPPLPAVTAPCFGASHTPDVGNLLAGCRGSELTGASRRSAAPLHGCAAQDPGLWCFL